MSTPAALVTEAALREFLARQRWFGGKARGVRTVRVTDEAALTARAWLTFVHAVYEDEGTDMYLVPLATARGAEATRIAREHAAAVVERSDAGDLVYDAIFDDEACRAMLDLARQGGEIAGAHGRLRGSPLEPGPDDAAASITRSGAEQSNTSVIFGKAFVLKTFRRLEGGVNPDVELSTFLTRRGFPHVPATVGSVEYLREHEDPASAIMVQRFVPNRGNAWEVTLASLGDYLRDGDASLDDHTGLAEQLGRRTGELHTHFASATEAALAPDSYLPGELDATASSMRQRAESQLELLQHATRGLPESVRTRAEELLEAREAVLAPFDALRELGGAATRIRCHGDYHLGQVLVTAGDVVILDFEGEPARPLAERRARASPLRDVAGMLRSFSYAAVAALRAEDHDADAERRARADRWEAAAGARFLRAYRDAAGPAGFLPRDDRDFDALLRAFTLDKAAYELGYELNNRPDWVDIPLVGLLRLAHPSATGAARLATGTR